MTIADDDREPERLRISGVLEVDRHGRHATFFPHGRDWPPIVLDIRSVTSQLVMETLLADLPGLREEGEEGE